MSAELEGVTASLTYGIGNNATDGYDDGIDANAPPADPSGFDAYFNEPGVGTGKLLGNVKALGPAKDWTIVVVAPATKTLNLVWAPGDILDTVDMQIQELDLNTAEPIGQIIDMKTQGQITFVSGAFAPTTKIYMITATRAEVGEPPELISCVIDPTPIVVKGTNTTVDCLFSETVKYEIRIENATGDLVEEIGSGTAKNPMAKWWNTTTETPAGIYTVNVTMDNSTSGMSSYNNTNLIEVTPAVDTTLPTIGDNTPTGTDVPVSAVINVTFDEAMNETSVEDAFSIDPSVTGSVSFDGCVMTFTPDADLAYETMYNVSIGTGAEDMAGNNLAEELSWEFTTESAVTYYGDADGDGYGDPANTTEASSAPAGYVANNTDCDDTNADVNPDAPEVYNGIDDNCDEVVDECCPTILSITLSPNVIQSDGNDTTNLTVKASDYIGDDIGIERVIVNLSAIGGSDEHTLTRQDGGLMTAGIWATTISSTHDGTFVLPVTVIDNDGSPTTTNVTLIAGLKTYTLSLKEGWNMIALPCDITTSGVDTTQKLGDLITGAGEDCYQVAWFDATEQRMGWDVINPQNNVPDGDEEPHLIIEGQGYFVLVDGDLDVVVAGTQW